MGRYITNFEAKHVNLWGLHTIKLDHKLHELRLFDDVSLAELIEKSQFVQFVLVRVSGCHEEDGWGGECVS